jgi:hypothetical protein
MSKGSGFRTARQWSNRPAALADECRDSMAHRATFGDQSGAVAEFDQRPFTIHPILSLVQKPKVIDARPF